MKKTLLCLGLLSMAVIITFSSCKKDNNNQNNNNNNNNPPPTQKVLKFLNIMNAKSLLIMNSSGKKKVNGVKDDSGNVLFKVTADGYVVEVPCIDQNGDTVTSDFAPTSICNLSDNYLTVTFLNYGTYLIRKSDGAVFTGSKLLVSVTDPTMIQQDSAGNIYYVYNQEVEKLNVTDPNNLTVSTYSASGDQCYYFTVDKFGNMVYPNNAGARYKHTTGGFEDINNCNGNWWTDVNNDSIYGRKTTLNICRLVPSSPLGFENYGDPTFMLGCAGDIVKIKNKNKVVGVGCDYVYELYNPQGVVSKLPTSYFNVTAINTLASSLNFYYIVGTNASYQSVILKVDPNGHTYTNLITTGDYDIYNVVVSSTDEVQFYALRMSDGKRVLAKIDNAGNITILLVLDGSTVTVLQQIN